MHSCKLMDHYKQNGNRIEQKDMMKYECIRETKKKRLKEERLRKTYDSKIRRVDYSSSYACSEQAGGQGRDAQNWFAREKKLGMNPQGKGRYSGGFRILSQLRQSMTFNDCNSKIVY